MSKPTVGFVGVGLMGHGMAKNLVSKGWPLVVLGHRKREPVEHLKSLGAREAATPRELAAQCEIVHLCVTGSPQVEATLRGPDGLLAGAAPGRWRPGSPKPWRPPPASAPRSRPRATASIGPGSARRWPGRSSISSSGRWAVSSIRASRSWISCRATSRW